MKNVLLLAVVALCAFGYYRHHAATDAAVTPVAAPSASTPKLHYHSPLDASNSHTSAGYFSTDPAEHYEVTGQRATASGRLTQIQPQTDASPAGHRP